MTSLLVAGPKLSSLRRRLFFRRANPKPEEHGAVGKEVESEEPTVVREAVELMMWTDLREVYPAHNQGFVYQC